MKTNESIRRLCFIILSACLVPALAETTRAQQTPAPGTFLISEFRTSGAGAQFGDQIRDEYVELYNNTDVAQDLQGYYLQFSDGTTDFVVGPLGFSVPVASRAHVLFANAPGYSLNGYAAPDFDVASGDTTADIFTENQGVALFYGDPVGPNVRVDAAGFAGNDAAYREGAGLPVFGGGGFTPPGVQYAYARKLTTGVPQATGDNAQDFVLVAASGGMLAGVQSVLGSPGPEISSSPSQINAGIEQALLDPQCAGTGATSSACLRARDTGATGPNAALGTLDIRRALFNRTGQTITSLRFRIVNITTEGNQTPGDADVRALDGTDTLLTRVDNTQVTALGLSVLTPPAQPNGGGLNTTLVPTSGTPLADGESVPVHFLLGVQQAGHYRYFVNVEATTSPSTSGEQTVTVAGEPDALPPTPVPLRRWALSRTQSSTSSKPSRPRSIY